MIKKNLITISTLIIIFSLVFFALKDKLSINKILNNIESGIGIKIELQNNQKWSYYPKISYENNLSLYGNENNLIVKNSYISITRDFGITSPFLIKYQSPSILYKGINFRDSKIISEYSDKIINIKKFSSKIIDGNIDINGSLQTNKNKEINLNGSYNNISINRILKQLKIADWERVQIKLSSSDFLLNTVNGSSETIIKNLNGIMDINGSIFFVSKEEERFGAAFLSLLADKFVSVKSISKSLNYLLNKFADIPSNISGKISIDKGVIITEKLLIENYNGKALLTANLNLNSMKINGKIDLYENNIIFLTAELKGNIENPEILIGGEIFSQKKGSKNQNIKTIFEKGIKSLVDDILKLND